MLSLTVIDLLFILFCFFFSCFFFIVDLFYLYIKISFFSLKEGEGLRVERGGLHDNWDDAEGYYSELLI